MSPEEAFWRWVVNKCTSRFSTARDEYAKQAWLEATRQAYEDAARICEDWGDFGYNGHEFAKAILRRAKEYDNEET